MADEWDLDKAQGFARRLKVIPGFPWDEDNILATAEDLLAWCKGAILGPGHVVSPESQAHWLVTTVRENWTEKWLGIGAMKRIFQEKFPPPPERPWKPATQEELIRRGLIRPPCQWCDDKGTIGKAPHIEYCSCFTGKHMRRWYGERELALLNQPREKAENDPPPLVPMLTLEQMREALKDEQRRKAEQLRKAGME